MTTLAPETLSALAELRRDLIDAPAAHAVERPRRRRDSDGETVLARAVGAWSSGTVLRIHAEPGDGVDGLTVSPLAAPEVRLRVAAGDIVIRRRGRTRVAPPTTAEPKRQAGIHVIADRRTIETAARYGVNRLENAVEHAVAEGHWLQLNPSTLHVWINDSVGVLLANRGETAAGRPRWKAVHVTRDKRTKGDRT